MPKSYTEISSARAPLPRRQRRTQPTRPLPTRRRKPRRRTQGKAKLEADLAAVKAKQGATPEEIAKAEKALADYPKPQKEAPQAQPKADFAKIDEEFAKTASSPTSPTKLSKRWASKAAVDLLHARPGGAPREYNGKVYTAAGGEPQYKAMIEWAQPDSRRPRSTRSTLPSQAATKRMRWLAKQGLSASSPQRTANSPTLAGGHTPRCECSAASARQAEMTAAMKDPRYKTTRRIRADVSGVSRRQAF
jgi:hypothetical protein